jgi:signal transduction histidine kinase
MRLRHLALSDCPMPMTANPVSTLSQSLAAARPWIQNVRCGWPAALVAGLAISAGLLAPAAALAGLLVATGLLAWQTHQLQRQRSELELIGQLLRCVNPHLGLEHSAGRMLRLTEQFFGASHCGLDLPGEPARDRPVGLREQPDALQRISVALPWQQGQAHLQLTGRRAWSQRERRVLEQIAQLAYAPLERIAQLEQLSAGAAERERQRLGLNLHDRVMQPYIGLKLALEALQTRPSPQLAAGLQSIVAMTEQVIDGLRGDLRRLAPGAAGAPAQAEPLATHQTATEPDPQGDTLAHDLAEQARLMHRLHGVRIAVRGPVPEALSQRLRHEVSEFIREALSNIRRHTHARSGEIELRCDGQSLGLRISNEAAAVRSDFAPRSISQRAQALGGWSEVRAEAGQRTAVHVTIPL